MNHLKNEVNYMKVNKMKDIYYIIVIVIIIITIIDKIGSLTRGNP
jgi:hypothetical protein